MNSMKLRGKTENHLEVYTLAEVGAILRVGRVTAWRMVTKGALKAFRAGKGWRVLRDDLIKFIEEGGGRGKRKDGISCRDGSRRDGRRGTRKGTQGGGSRRRVRPS